MSNHELGGETIEAVQEMFAGIVIVLTDGLIMFLRLFKAREVAFEMLLGFSPAGSAGQALTGRHRPPQTVRLPY